MKIKLKTFYALLCFRSHYFNTYAVAHQFFLFSLSRCVSPSLCLCPSFARLLSFAAFSISAHFLFAVLSAVCTYLCAFYPFPWLLLIKDTSTTSFGQLWQPAGMSQAPS